ncbi:DNA alkylation repair protein [Thiohalorhabdus methylotrophus]|uniref:DNA alkylation repair protein n=1 Tax=Thiohalorhabdus methylotrophus TaxID=3242694 RepID=A0ABV4TTE6_9GAMM
MDANEVLEVLRSRSEPDRVTDRVRQGVRSENALGVSEEVIEELATSIGTDHELALSLWESGAHEARLLATRLADAERVDDEQAEAWVASLDSWELSDQASLYLFRRMDRAWRKAEEWTEREEEQVKRAAFALIAALAMYDLDAGDDRFSVFYPAIEMAAGDQRERVREAVSWALRRIGLRSAGLYDQALEIARGLQEQPEEAARWVGQDVLGELDSEEVRARMRSDS